ncbi:hypothetical protein ACSFBM_13120 [Variovorax sp. GB1R11]
MSFERWAAAQFAVEASLTQNMRLGAVNQAMARLEAADSRA